jgi:transposase InsO family protein
VLRRLIESAQYTSAAYAALADECEATLSIGRTGQCWDNALAESFFPSHKGEHIDTWAWSTSSRRQAGGRGVHQRYNGTRLHSGLG